MEEERKEAQVKVETLEAQLKEWGIDLETFRAKAGKAKTKAKVKLDNEVAASLVARTACDLASPEDINRLIEHENKSLQS